MRRRIADPEVVKLFLKYINDECSQSELTQVLSLLKSGKHVAEWDKAIATDSKFIQDSRLEGLLTNQEQLKLYSKIHTTVHPSIPDTVQRGNWRNIFRNFVYSAAAILFLAGVGLFFFKDKKVTHTGKAVTAARIDSIETKAFLILGNGTKISLSDAANGDIAKQEGINIRKTAEGKIVYEIIDHTDNTNNDISNTIQTPKGGHFHVQLPDGTKVLLNAATSLVYPVSFKGRKERLVKLTGEAYFEVAPDKEKKFKVLSGGQVVEVLGTGFNIEAYLDDHTVKTTLFHGKVKLTYKNVQAVLKPGQTAVSNPERLIETKKANLDEVLAWKEGLLSFNDEDIATVMRKVGRWYDVEVEFRDGVEKKRFWGTVSYYKDIRELLDNIAIAGNLHYRKEGNKVVLMK